MLILKIPIPIIKCVIFLIKTLPNANLSIKSTML